MKQRKRITIDLTDTDEHLARLAKETRRSKTQIVRILFDLAQRELQRDAGKDLDEITGAEFESVWIGYDV